MAAQIRLDKYLVEMGLGSRNQVKEYAKKGLVSVNGTIEKKCDIKIDPETAQVSCNGTPIAYHAFEYFMLHKPAGYVSATTDTKDATVLDLLKPGHRKDLFPVGRLDKDTEGLLLITNDGPLAHQLLSPKKHVDKTYYAKIDGIVTNEDVIKFQNGLDIGEDKPTLPAKLTILSTDKEESEIEITIQEGKFHQVKRMFQAVGKTVIYLKRISFGTLILDEALPKGEYRPLTQTEINLLKNSKSQHS